LEADRGRGMRGCGALYADALGADWASLHYMCGEELKMKAARKEHRFDARTLTCRNWRSGEAHGLHYGIVERGPDLRDLLVFAAGIYTVGE
jgi:hypothetical protein